MMRRLILILALLCLFLPLSHLKAQSVSSSDYEIAKFDSQITLNQDTSLLIVETITVNFPAPKHGIYRIIPVYYSSRGRTINSRLKVLSITDEAENPYKYSQSRLRQSVSLKIGDPDRVITGLHTYIISYKVEKVLEIYDGEPEIYWNVTGSEWDTEIASVRVEVNSPYAEIVKVDCFAGLAGTTDKYCSSNFDKSKAIITSTSRLGTGRDLTVVLGLSSHNVLKFPTQLQQIVGTIIDNLGYVLAVLPLGLLSAFWFKKGRDRKYAGDNVYYVPDDKKEEVKPLFAREHLPLVYSPINGLTPAQVGTIIDEKVDIADVVSEIVELGRLGYLRIKKTEEKGLIFSKTDYSFTKAEKDTKDLAGYQKYLLDKIFSKDTKTDKSGNKYILLSSLKNNFYKHLGGFREKLYKNLADEGYFDGDPDKVRKKWLGIGIGFYILGFIIVSVVGSTTGNFAPSVVLFITIIPAVFLVISMPRKTAWGYSLFRQTKGLAFYLKKGKWREEVNEKHLFLEEMLPLAIALGVVDRLTKDMQQLGVAPPSYFSGFVAASLYSDISGFSKDTSSSLISSPGGSWSGASSWSGGSGFGGGGFSGGGFGGGGGGSW